MDIPNLRSKAEEDPFDVVRPALKLDSSSSTEINPGNSIRAKVAFDVPAGTVCLRQWRFSIR